MTIRCKCGKYLRGSARWCSSCAVEFARGIDTDRFSKVVEDVESIMVDDKKQTTQRFNPNQFQHIGTVRQINQAVQDHRGRMFWRRFIAGFIIAAIVILLAFWKLRG